ncbi:MAG: TonB-dependent receptor [Helicobacter sp.]|nr:TonB-dependent receptor [Helicobacter sp.]
MRHIIGIFVLGIGIGSSEPFPTSSDDLSDSVLNPPTPLGPNQEIDILNNQNLIFQSENLKNKAYDELYDGLFYTPILNFTNFHSGINYFQPINADLRGGGDLGHANTKVLIDNAPQNQLFATNGILDTQGLLLHDEIIVLPGANTVLYGSGSRNGVIIAKSKKRYRQIGLNFGLTYWHFPIKKVESLYQIGINMGMRGRFIQISKDLYYSIQSSFNFKNMPRQNDSKKLASMRASLLYDKELYKITFDVSSNLNQAKTSPYNLFTLKDDGQTVQNFPSHKTQHRSGVGEFDDTFAKYLLNMGFEYSFIQRGLVETNAFYQIQNTSLNLHEQSTWLTNSSNALTFDRANQDFSVFEDYKYGNHIKVSYQHDDGLLIVGSDIIVSRGINKRRGLVLKNELFETLDARKSENAIYAFENYRLFDFDLGFGGRYEFSKYLGKFSFKDTDNYKIFQINDFSSNFALNFMPKISFIKKASRLDLYAKYERGFTSPTADLLHTRIVSEASNSGIKSETFHSAELGIKYQNNILSVGANTFYTLSSNEFYILGYPNSFDKRHIPINLDLSQHLGIDLLLDMAFLDESIKLSQSISYTDARILRSKIAPELNGKSIPNALPLKVTFDSEFELPYSLTGWLQASFFGGAKDYVNANIPSLSLPFISPLLDLGLRYKVGFLDIGLGVRNAIGVVYFSYYNSDPSDGVGGYSYSAAAGRTYFLNSKYKF